MHLKIGRRASMRAKPASPSPQLWLQVLLVLLIAVSLGRLAIVVPEWAAGDAPAFPGQYERRLLGTLATVPLLSAVLLNMRSGIAPTSRTRRVLIWTLLGAAVLALLVNVLKAP
jgi:hypothetical protein